MLKRIASLTTVVVLSLSTSSLAENIELDWTSSEIGFFEKANEAGEMVRGIAVYVPGSRLAFEDDFLSIFPEFCSLNLPALLEFNAEIEGAPEISFLKLQIDYYGPKVGETEPYIARAATVDVDNGECIF